jgi:hypothetical protein
VELLPGERSHERADSLSSPSLARLRSFFRRRELVAVADRRHSRQGFPGEGVRVEECKEVLVALEELLEESAVGSNDVFITCVSESMFRAGWTLNTSTTAATSNTTIPKGSGTAATAGAETGMTVDRTGSLNVPIARTMVNAFSNEKIPVSRSHP